MGNIIEIDISKLREVREIKAKIDAINSQLGELLIQQSDLIGGSNNMWKISFILSDVYKLGNKRICGDCLTDREVLQVLNRKEGAPKSIDKAKLLPCSRCGEECGN